MAQFWFSTVGDRCGAFREFSECIGFVRRSAGEIPLVPLKKVGTAPEVPLSKGDLGESKSADQAAIPRLRDCPCQF